MLVDDAEGKFKWTFGIPEIILFGVDQSAAEVFSFLQGRFHPKGH